MREADLAACASIVLALPLWRAYGLVTEAAARASFSDVFAGACRALVAEDGGHVIGHVVFAVRGTFIHSGYVRSLAVAPERQRRGVGGALMDAAETAILAEGPNVFLMVNDQNAGAQRFYERRGYRRVGLLSDYIRRGITEALYRKTVAPIDPAQEVRT
jgi:ribosomal protein S18 acetylase RimI-like enzyme